MGLFEFIEHAKLSATLHTTGHIDTLGAQAGNDLVHTREMHTQDPRHRSTREATLDVLKNFQLSGCGLGGCGADMGAKGGVCLERGTESGQGGNGDVDVFEVHLGAPKKGLNGYTLNYTLVEVFRLILDRIV